MKAITLEPISRIEGEINLPGSKSLSNRALLLAALAKGTTTVTNLLDSDDIRHMLNALKALGVNYQLSENKTCCEVEGLGGAFQVENGLSLFLGNAGTALRPALGQFFLVAHNFVLLSHSSVVLVVSSGRLSATMSSRASAMRVWSETPVSAVGGLSSKASMAAR